MSKPQPFVSAHRCLTRDAIEAAIALGADYVEIDIRRCADGSLVVHHDPVDVAPPDTLTYAEALDLIAGRAGVHLDLKFRGDLVEAVRIAVARLGTDGLVVTTGTATGVRAVRSWADGAGQPLLVGLSLGRARELWPEGRYAHSRANVVVAHHWLARLRVARFARRRRMPLLVWTVDSPWLLRHWMRPGRAWLVTTNNPALALHLRADKIDL